MSNTLARPNPISPKGYDTMPGASVTGIISDIVARQGRQQTPPPVPTQPTTVDSKTVSTSNTTGGSFDVLSGGPVTVAAFAFTVAGGGTRTPVGWTTVSVPSQVPTTARYLLCRFTAFDSGDPPGSDMRIVVRKDSVSPEFPVIDGSIYTVDSDVEHIVVHPVPISASRTFDYKVEVGFREGWSINVIAYFT